MGGRIERHIGLSKDEALNIVGSTMFGGRSVRHNEAAETNVGAAIQGRA